VDFAHDFEAAAMLIPALAPRATWWGRHRPTRLPSDISFQLLPLAASSRRLLIRALDVLRSWSRWRNFNMLVGPAIKLEAYWDALMPPPFMQPYIETDD